MAKNEDPKTQKIYDALKKKGGPFLLASTDVEKTEVYVHGLPSDLLYLLHKAYYVVYDELLEMFPKRLAEELMKAVTLTDDEVKAAVEEPKEKKEIPAWLRKLMDLEEEEDEEEDEDDSTDEIIREEERTKAISKLADALHRALHDDIDPDDADRSDD